MKEKTSLMDRIDAKRDAIGEKLAAKEVEFPVELAAGMLFLLCCWACPHRSWCPRLMW